MALPFIVGLHQCSLTHGPDGRPQVEVVLRIRLPLAEFFDALLLSLADQRPLFQQSGYGTAQASPVPVKAGLQTGGHIGPMPKEDAPPYWKATSRAQPKRPSHPPKHAPKVDPTHEKLLAVLSQSASISDTAAVGAAATANDLPTPSIDEGSMMSTTQPGKSQSNRQAFGKVLAGHILPAGQESVLYWLGAGSWRLQTLPTVLGGGGRNRLWHKPWWDWWCRAGWGCRDWRQSVHLRKGEGSQGFPRFWGPGLPSSDCTAVREEAFCLLEDTVDHCSLWGTPSM